MSSNPGGIVPFANQEITSNLPTIKTPEPALSDRVNDVAKLFVNGRLIGKLRDFTVGLIDAGAELQQASIDSFGNQYATLRSAVLDEVTHPELAAVLEERMPVIDSGSSLEMLAFAANQSAAAIEAVSDMDAYVIGQRIAMVNAMNMLRQVAKDQLVTQEDPPSMGGVGQYV